MSFHVIKKNLEPLDVLLVVHIESNHYFLFVRKVGMVLRGGSDIKLRQPRSKKEKMVDNSKLRPWSELHEALLRLITKQLGAIDYLMFGCVCRGWTLHVTTHWQEFMASNLQFLSSYQRKLRELLISIASLSKGCTRQNCLTLMANDVLG